MSTSLMLVDDDQIQHSIVELIIKRLNLSVDLNSYVKAQDVLSFLIKHHKNYSMLPDIILLDLDMPDISGWDFMDIFEIFQQYFPKVIPVIILTSSIDPKDRERSATYTCVKGYYSKPFTQEIMENILEATFMAVSR